MRAMQLIAQLQRLPHNSEVLLPSDPEGNSYSRVFQLDFCPPEDDTRHYITDQLKGRPIPDDAPIILLWPAS